LVESAALLQARLGLPSAILFLKDAKSFEVEWVDLDLHEEAEKELERIGKRGISLVDCTSFIVMRRKGVDKVLGFDPDFRDQGFSIY
jgi:predicted nucleic acid-binding protein